MPSTPPSDPRSLDTINLSFRQLQYLVALADHLHFGRAARACHVTQPALSEQLRQLEDALGVRLIERSSRRVRLTEVGEMTAARARAILRQVDDLIQTARQTRGVFALPLRLGVIPTIAPYFLPRVLPPLRREFPRLQLFLREDRTARLLEQLRDGRLDLLLLALPIEGKDLEVLEFFTEPFLFVTQRTSAWAKRKRIEPIHLAGQEILLLEEGHCLRDQALDLCGAAQAREHPQFRAASLSTLVQMVANGLGATLLPRMAVEVEIRRGDALVVLPFRPPEPVRRIGLVWRQGAPRAREIQTLCKFFQSHTPAK